MLDHFVVVVVVILDDFNGNRHGMFLVPGRAKT
jgi:hypothetical protein